MRYLPLCENHLYLKTFRGGEKKFCATLSVYVLKDKKAWLIKKENPLKQSLNRVGISVSGKFGSAVERNRAKRLVREAYRLIDKEYKLSTGKLIVISPKEKIKTAKMQDVYADMLKAFFKLGIAENNNTNA